jgi:hypothetical protein
MDTRGWSDIAYNHLVCKHGFWFEGRGWNSRNGANSPVNDSTYSICWEGTTGNRVDRAVIQAINQIIGEGVKKGYSGQVRGHKDVRLSPTACPGELYPLIGGLIPYPDAPALPDPVTTQGTPIMGDAQVPFSRAYEWAKQGTFDLMHAASLYYVLAPALNVRPEVALAQAAKETNWGRFTGTVPREYNNWCGLKTTAGGGNFDAHAHQDFQDDAEGVQAHLEHLHLYAKGQLPNPVDPRHFASVAGTAPTVEELGGKWAPNPDYGNSVVDRLETM